MLSEVSQSYADNVLDRFMRRILFFESDSCWLWDGTKNNAGYGSFRYGLYPKFNRGLKKAKKEKAHRVSYMLANNCWLKNTEHILHSCDNPPCVNPAHLRKGTHSENMQEMHLKKRWRKHGNGKI